jgi:hypothetical protein
MAYGIQIYNGSGDLTLDTATRCSSIVVSGTVSIITSSTATAFYYIGLSSAISMPGILNGNDSEYEVWMSPTFSLATSNILAESVDIKRPGDISSGVPADGTFVIRFNGSAPSTTKTFIYYGFRY